MALFASQVALAGANRQATSESVGSSDRVLATWRNGSLTLAEFEEWRQVHGLEYDDEAIREMAYVLSMAEAARQRGEEKDRRTVLEQEATRQRLLSDALRQKLNSEVSISDEEVEQVRRENPDALASPRKLKLRHIYKRWDSDSPEDQAAVRARMNVIHDQLVDGAEFGPIARAESESQTRFRDGLVGFLDPDEMPDVLAAAVATLTPGQISPVVEHGEALSIFLCEEIREASTKKFEDVREIWRGRLLQRRQKQIWMEREKVWLDGVEVLDPAASEAVLVMDGYRLAPGDLEHLVAIRVPHRSLDSVTAAASRKVLEEWALGVAAVRQAEELGLHRRPDLEAALRWRSVGVLAHMELVRRIDDRLKPSTDRELRDVYEQQKHRLVQTGEVHLAMIHFGTIADHEDPARWTAEVRAAVEAIESGDRSLADVAREYSLLDSAAAGGDEGWRSVEVLRDLGARFMSALRALEPGDTSGLLRLESGLWFFELRGRRPARLQTLEEAESQLRHLARKEQVAALEQVVRDEQLAAIGLVLADRPGSW